jgi:nitrite reductase/ring-hydroxylating ferredoxin subunit
MVPAAIGVVTFLSPLRPKSRSGQNSASGRLRKLATLDLLPADGTPVIVPVIDVRDDAFTRMPPAPIGRVFLRRTGQREKPVAAFQAKCPHAGCDLVFDASGGQPRFICPCHSTPSFGLDGVRLDADSGSPRDMDELEEVEIRDGNEVWVRFEKYRQGIAGKEPVA